MVAEIDKRTDNLVSSWLPLPDVADRLRTDVNRVRQLVRERQLIAARRSERDALEVPEAFIEEGKVLKGLSGTLTLLADSGFADDEALRWLFTEDASLPGAPVTALREHRGTEVKRRAQALGL
jgi:hypothetical protein